MRVNTLFFIREKKKTEKKEKKKREKKKKKTKFKKGFTRIVQEGGREECRN